jgi:hypothetical protein
MQIIAHHHMLVAGNSYESCRKQVMDFLNRTQLVCYDLISIDEREVKSGTHPDFEACTAEAVQKNRHILEGLIKDLENTGVRKTSDLLNLQQGYPSKVLHITAHFLDGFIGIDSIFYNLIDDSHWLPEPTRQAILAQPDGYWLIPVDCFSDTPDKAGLIQQ